ncbi:NUDIX pyrophosphatase [Thermoplasma sp.]|uniref:NUDIX hydrolase n=1 Tax=Thermoplasma sp. TaxID=1973142 RepID=UPI00261745C3|nr:NUDIX pyrophosphatase [Thermoplasma sp.]
MSSTRTGVKVQAVIYRCGKWPEFLILHRNKEHGDFWQNVTGNVEPGEDLGRALLREVREETGIGSDCIMHIAHRIMAFRFRAHEMDFIEYVYAIRVRDSCPIDISNNVDREHDAYEWVSLDRAVRTMRWYTNADAVRIANLIASAVCSRVSDHADKKN